MIQTATNSIEFYMDVLLNVHARCSCNGNKKRCRSMCIRCCTSPFTLFVIFHFLFFFEEDVSVFHIIFLLGNVAAGLSWVHFPIIYNFAQSIFILFRHFFSSQFANVTKKFSSECIICLCLPPTQVSCLLNLLTWHWLIQRHPQTISWHELHLDQVPCLGHSI